MDEITVYLNALRQSSELLCTRYTQVALIKMRTDTEALLRVINQRIGGVSVRATHKPLPAKIGYRCDDCGVDFGSQQALNSHKGKKHRQ
jgi:hypothetical protein